MVLSVDMPSRRVEKSVRRVGKRAAARRFEELSAERIEFIDNDVFEQADAAEIVLARELTPVRYSNSASTSSGPKRTSRLRRLADCELLPADEEAETFRRMNYWKHQACALRERIQQTEPSAKAVAELEGMLARARELRDRIVQGNLRLVISVVKKFVDANNSLDDLLSEGTMSLLRAVEKFDYARGFRFSTYATYAIRRNLYRFVVARRQDRTRFEARGADFADTSSDDAVGRITEERWHELHRRLSTILRRLDPREQMVISARFGLGDQADVETLQSLADRMGVCKERVRQLEKRAMMKLRKLAGEAALEELGE
jgi:RNA polymerase primary sigma factor